MANLSDVQVVLLSTAATRQDGSLLPPPESLGTRADRIRRSIEALLKRGLAREERVSDRSKSFRAEGGLLFGATISEEGRAAVGVEAPPPPAGVRTAGNTKISKVLQLLGRREGASLDDLMRATGWLPHSTRAALTGLRKKGHALEKRKQGEVTCYHLPAAA